MESGNRARPTALGRDAKIEKLKKLIEGFRDSIGQIQDSEIKEKSESLLGHLDTFFETNKNTKNLEVNDLDIERINLLIQVVKKAKLLIESPTKENLKQANDLREVMIDYATDNGVKFTPLQSVYDSFRSLTKQVENSLVVISSSTNSMKEEIFILPPENNNPKVPVASKFEEPEITVVTPHGEGSHTEKTEPSNSAPSPVKSELFAEEKKLWRNRFKEMLQGYLADKGKAFEAVTGRISIARVDGHKVTSQDIQEALQELDSNGGEFTLDGKYEFSDKGRSVGNFVDAFAESNQPLDTSRKLIAHSHKNTEMLKNTLSTTLGLSYSDQMIYEALPQIVFGDLIIQCDIESSYKEVFDLSQDDEKWKEYLEDQQSFRMECFRIAGNAILQHHLIKVLDELRQVLPVSEVPNNITQDCMAAGREIYVEVNQALQQGEFDFDKVTTKELIPIIELVRLTKTAIVEPTQKELIPRLTQNLQHLRSNIPSKPTAFKYKLLGAGLAVLGVALIGLAIATAVVSHGASSPLSIAGIGIGVNIILGGLAMAGVGVFASLAGASISFGMWERTAAKEKQLNRFHGIQKAGGKVKAAVQKAEKNPKVSSGDSSLDLPIPGKFKQL